MSKIPSRGLLLGLLWLGERLRRVEWAAASAALVGAALVSQGTLYTVAVT